MKRTDLAYIAGLFDGEGCIRIGRCKKISERTPSYSLNCSLSIGNQYLPELLRMYFGGGIRERNLPPPRKKQWDWQIHGENAIAFLKDIYSYMVLKKNQADVAFRFQASIRDRKNANRYRLTDKEKIVREAEYILLRNLKKE